MSEDGAPRLFAGVDVLGDGMAHPRRGDLADMGRSVLRPYMVRRGDSN